MFSEKIPYKSTEQFSKIIIDYLDSNLDGRLFDNDFSLEGFQKKIMSRESQPTDRDLLVEVLESQNSEIKLSDLTISNISSLKNNNTFTVCTGHQLSLFGGPLYFVYKIASTIKLTETLKSNFGDYNFVPIFWLASEDHDFEEVNHFFFGDHKFLWNREANGPVGRMSCDGLEQVFAQLQAVLPDGFNSKLILQIFRESYLSGKNLSDATRFFVNTLFGSYGLVILDADDQRLKKHFVPIAKRELFERISFNQISQNNLVFDQLKYKKQVNPREINLFLIDDNKRERIQYSEDRNVYYTTDLAKSYSQDEIIDLLQSNPEMFSPNVVLRPVYQELILPNLAYIGGGGELAYWMQLKSSFEQFVIPFPILILRNSFLLIDGKTQKRMSKLGISSFDLFLERDFLISRKAQEENNLNLDEEFKNLDAIFENILLKTPQGHPLNESMQALRAKQNKLLLDSEKKIHRYNKSKQELYAQQLDQIFEQIQPKGKMQERRMNLSEAIIEFGPNFIEKLMSHVDVFDKKFTILRAE